MARCANKSAKKPTPNGANKNEEKRRMSGSERSAYFARREAAKVLKMVLQGDAKRRAVASIKSLIYRPSIRNKKGTFALVCQTLKRKFLAPHLALLESFVNSLFNLKWYTCVLIEGT